MFSKTGIGAAITLVVTVLSLFGVELPEGSAASLTESLAQILGVLLIVIGQLQRKDLKMGILRK